MNGLYNVVRLATEMTTIAGVAFRAGHRENWAVLNRTLPGCYIDILQSAVQTLTVFQKVELVIS